MTASTTATIPTDAAIEVSSHRRRRTALRKFGDPDGPAAVDQHAETVLDHGHLPTLGRAAVVDHHGPDGSFSFVGNRSVEGLLRGWW